MADSGEPVHEEEIAEVPQDGTEVDDDGTKENLQAKDTPTNDGDEASDILLASGDKSINADDTSSKQDDQKEEVFDFSSEHPFEDNDEAVEEALAADQADEEKVHDDEKDGIEMNKDVEDDEEEEEDEDADDAHPSNSDPNVMPQVNVAVLAQRKWQVKVYPLKPTDFVNGQISRVFKYARESLLYLLSPGRNARGKGEMYISTASQAMRAVFSLMRLGYYYPEINVEIIKKSDEGSVEEKAYIRFDCKMTNLLTMGSFRAGPGRKRERLIGSVFVKNLPPGTTKDVLRVMFPFAQEINYNPEKFKDCTARLVLKSRNHVIPCLKAFAKVELGGNVLELHPLEKKKRVRAKEDDEDVPEAKHRKKSEDVEKKDESTNKEEEASKPEVKSSEAKKDSAKHENAKETKGESKEKSEVRSIESKEKKVSKSTFQKTPASRRGVGSRYGSGKKERHDQGKPYRPKLNDGQERSTRGSAGLRRGSGRSDWSADRGDRNKGRQEKVSGPNRGFRDNDRNKSNRSQGGGGRNFGRTSRGFGGARSGQMERMNYRMANQSLATSVAPSSTNLAINADATKEMVILQNQLSMAIKNQLAMLNQTQMAVEQAKRGASSLGIGADVQQTGRTSGKTFGGTSGASGFGKRAAEHMRRSQNDDMLDVQYSSQNRSRERAMRSPRGAQGGGGYGKRGGSFREQMKDSYYDRASDLDLGLSQGHDVYGRSSRDFGYDMRDVNTDGFGSPGRSGYGQDAGGYSGYHY